MEIVLLYKTLYKSFTILTKSKKLNPTDVKDYNFTFLFCLKIQHVQVARKYNTFPDLKPKSKSNFIKYFQKDG